MKSCLLIASLFLFAGCKHYYVWQGTFESSVSGTCKVATDVYFRLNVFGDGGSIIVQNCIPCEIASDSALKAERAKADSICDKLNKAYK